MKLYRWIHSTICLACSVLSLSIPSSINLSLNSTGAIFQDNQAAAAAARNVSAPVICRPKTHGVFPREASCRNAWSKIPRTAVEQVYRTRGQLPPDVVVPIRYQSDDGWCVIEVRPSTMGKAVRGDTTTGIAVSDAAKHVIDICISERPIPSGGTFSGFSTSPALVYILNRSNRIQAMKVTQYSTARPSVDSNEY